MNDMVRIHEIFITLRDYEVEALGEDLQIY